MSNFWTCIAQLPWASAAQQRPLKDRHELFVLFTCSMTNDFDMNICRQALSCSTLTKWLFPILQEIYHAIMLSLNALVSRI